MYRGFIFNVGWMRGILVYDNSISPSPVSRVCDAQFVSMHVVDEGTLV